MQSFAEMIDFIRPQQIGRYWFIGHSPEPQPRIFGGQVLAQALMAAYDTVAEPLIAHSLHGYFLRPGNANEIIELEVDPIRDGRSFCTRRVVARQQGKAIFNASAISRMRPGLLRPKHCSQRQRTLTKFAVSGRP